MKINRSIRANNRQFARLRSIAAPTFEFEQAAMSKCLELETNPSLRPMHDGLMQGDCPIRRLGNVFRHGTTVRD